MTQLFRTSAGGWIDRAAPLRFTFDGRPYVGCAGDTLASALLANGVHLTGRSFKHHRPRGIYSAGVEEPNALVEIDRGPGRRTPNLQATQVELYDGLAARSQNRWPSLRFDALAALGAAPGLTPPGFYYKTFMWPGFAWKRIYEPLIRRAAGLGRAPREPDPDRYANRYAHCDVLVVGSGPAGLSAALAASETGARVVLCEQDGLMGGALRDETRALVDGCAAVDFLKQALEVLRARDNVQVLARTTAFGVYADNLVALAERLGDHLAAPDPSAPRERLWQVRARRVVLAAGAIERPLVFPDNDRPGVMLADAARVYAKRFGVRAGSRALVAASHDSAWLAALELHAAGVDIALLIDTRDAVAPRLREAAARAGVDVQLGTRMRGARGRLRVRSARIEAPNGARDVPCDLVLAGGGWTPTLHLFAHVRGKLVWSDALGAFAPDNVREDLRCAGACNGALDLSGALAEGWREGASAAVFAGFPEPAERAFRVEDDWPCAGGAPAQEAPEGEAYVDIQNDVKASDYAIALREGFRSIEHVKRYTTSGLGADQGKTGNVNASALVGALSGRAAAQVGLTTYRQPYTPVTFGALAHMARGALFEPQRETPTHARALAAGATFEDAGQWKRARAFPRAGETEAQAAAREALAVRGAAGLFDASTLGKIEVAGPDALAFLQRMYVNDFSGLAVGRCRYALMLHETGFVMDDGIVARLAHDRFHVTTTSGGAASALHHMEDFRQTEFTQLRVWLTPVTEQWATLALQGPRARDILAPLVQGFDLSPAAMPHMSVREGALCGVPLRLMRASFSGELGFEINVPADNGAAAWDLLLEAGRPHGLAPYGLEALDVLRAEKGFVIVGQDTDGAQTPADLGMARMVGTRKGDFVGARSLRLPHLASAGRRQLVGLRPRGPAPGLEEGMQLVGASAPAPGTHAQGHVTTVRQSPTLARTIALGLLESGRMRIGETIHALTPDGALELDIVAPAFFDPEGTRLHG
ncbi:MAG: sarcosine oxidase subunit alpha [Hyphomicrobiales bacterium]|nr:sarcosine oxidase subunit alpha [Hyphomicrobiales bacterium]